VEEIEDISRRELWGKSSSFGGTHNLYLRKILGGFGGFI